MMGNQTESQHILELAKEIMDDIELSRLNAMAILLKGTRLSRYVGNDEVRQWLRFEMQGFPQDNPIAEKYMTKTGRWTNKEKGEGYRIPFSQVEASMDSEEKKLKNFRIPDAISDNAKFIITDLTNTNNSTSQGIAVMGGIVGRVISILHDFATSVYYEKVFDGVGENIFSTYRKDIDALITQNSGDIIDQIPHVYASLDKADNESVSQALITCKKLIDAFVNHIYPPTDQSISILGNEISLKADQVMNRMNAYIQQNCESDSRKKKLRQNIHNLYERISVPYHADVDVQEARSLFLNVYLLLGEILTLPKSTNPKKPISSTNGFSSIGNDRGIIGELYAQAFQGRSERSTT